MKKKMSVLIVMALAAGSAFAAVDVTDPPDVRVLTNAAAEDVYDINNYVSGGAATGDIVGADGLVDIPGSDTPGLTDYSVAVDGETLTVTRKVSSAMLDNQAMADSNGTLDGDTSANWFYVCLRSGVTATSNAPLSGGPVGGPGGNGTPGNGTPGNGTPAGAAAWVITFSTVTCGNAPSGLATRSSAVTAEGESPLSAGGLTAEVDDAGNYSLTADDTFVGPVLVTFVKKAGADMDGASVLASSEVSVGADYAGNDFSGAVEFIVNAPGATSGTDFGGASPPGSDGVGLAAPGGGLILLPIVQMSGKLRISASVLAPNGATVGIGAMDSSTLGGGGQNLALAQVSGGSESPVNGRVIATYFEAPSGSFSPIINIDGEGPVHVDNLCIIPAAEDTCYDPTNSPVGYDITNDADFSRGAALATDFSAGLNGKLNLNNQPHNAPTLAGANNFATGGTPGSVELTADGTNLSNITWWLDESFVGPAMLNVGCFAHVMSGDADLFLAVVVSALGADNALAFNTTFISLDNLSTSEWLPVSTFGAIQDGSVGTIVTIQLANSVEGSASTGTLHVDDLSAMTVGQTLATFDATTLGSL